MLRRFVIGVATRHLSRQSILSPDAVWARTSPRDVSGKPSASQTGRATKPCGNLGLLFSSRIRRDGSRLLPVPAMVISPWADSELVHWMRPAWRSVPLPELLLGDSATAALTTRRPFDNAVAGGLPRSMFRNSTKRIGKLLERGLSLLASCYATVIHTERAKKRPSSSVDPLTTSSHP